MENMLVSHYQQNKVLRWGGIMFYYTPCKAKKEILKMKEIVFVYNYGDVDFIDGFREEKICIKSKKHIPMTYIMARYFIGDSTPRGTMDAAFRRGGIAPTLKAFESEEEMAEYINRIPGKDIVSTDEHDIHNPIPLSPKDSVEVISFGKFAGQAWEDVLTPENFDVKYWAVVGRTSKSIPDNRKAQINVLLRQARMEKDGDNSSGDSNSDK